MNSKNVALIAIFGLAMMATGSLGTYAALKSENGDKALNLARAEMTCSQITPDLTSGMLSMKDTQVKEGFTDEQLTEVVLQPALGLLDDTGRKVFTQLWKDRKVWMSVNLMIDSSPTAYQTERAWKEEVKPFAYSTCIAMLR